MTSLLGCDALAPGFPDDPVVALEILAEAGVVDRVGVAIDVEGCDASGIGAVDIYAGSDRIARWTRETHDLMGVDVELADLELRPPWPGRAEFYAEARCRSGVVVRGVPVEVTGLVPASQRLGEVDSALPDSQFYWDSTSDEMINCAGVRYDAELHERSRGPEAVCRPADRLYVDAGFVSRIDRDRAEISVYDRDLAPLYHASGAAAAWLGDSALAVLDKDDSVRVEVFDAGAGELWAAELPSRMEIQPQAGFRELDIPYPWTNWLPAVRRAGGDTILISTLGVHFVDATTKPPSERHVSELHLWSVDHTSRTVDHQSIVANESATAANLVGGVITPGGTAAMLWGTDTTAALDLKSGTTLWTRPSNGTSTFVIPRGDALLYNAASLFIVVGRDGSILAEHNAEDEANEIMAWDPVWGLIYRSYTDSNLAMLDQELELVWEAYVPYQTAAFDREAHPLFFDGRKLLRGHSAFEYRNGL